MPIFNLSSKGESNHSNFTNFLNDTVTIKPFSKIALIGAQLCRKDETQTITIPPNTVIFIRFNAYDIFPICLNCFGTAPLTLSLLAFCQSFNSQIPDNTALRRGVQLTIDSQDPGEPDNLRMVFYHTLNLLQDYEVHMYNNAEYARQYWNTCTGQALPTFGPGNTGVGNNQPQIRGTLGATQFAVAMGFDLNKYTVPTNQVNGNAFNLQLEQFEIENQNSFIIGQPNIPGLEIVFGRGTNDTATNMSAGPIFGTGQYNNPGAAWGNVLLKIELKANGDSVLQVYNSTTNQLDTLLTGGYNPGEVWEVMAVALDAPINVRKKAYFRVGRKRSNGLAYWFFNTPAAPASMWFNNPNSKASGLALNEFYTPSLTQRSAPVLDALFTAKNMDSLLKVTGPRACAGHGGDTSLDAQANTEEVVNARYFNNAAGPDVLEAFTAIAGQPTWYNGAILLRRYAPAEAPALQPARRDIFQLTEENQPLKCSTPFMVSIFVNFIDDTAKITANNVHTILSSDRATNVPVVKAGIANIEAWDIEVNTVTGPLAFALLDSLGARINIGLNKQYSLQIRYFGSGLPSVTVNMCDVAAAALAGDGVTGFYSATQLIGAATNFVHNIGYIGGNFQGTASDYGTRGAFYFADFRYYQKCNRAGLGPNIWDPPLNSISAFNLNGGTDINWFFAPLDDPDYEVLLPRTLAPKGSEPEYINIGFMRPEETVSVVVQRPTNTPSIDGYWWDLQNIYYRPSTILKNSFRNINRVAAAYAGPQEGLVDVAGWGVIDVDFVDPQADANSNVLNIPNGDPRLIGPTNPTSRILMDVDFVRAEDKILDVQITNLPHRSYNGTNHMNDKTIYRVLNRGNENVTNLNNVRISEIDVPERVYIPLENGSEYHINKLDVKITDIDGKEEADLTEDTYVSVEIL